MPPMAETSDGNARARPPSPRLCTRTLQRAASNPPQSLLAAGNGARIASAPAPGRTRSRPGVCRSCGIKYCNPREAIFRNCGLKFFSFAVKLPPKPLMASAQLVNSSLARQIAGIRGRSRDVGAMRARPLLGAREIKGLCVNLGPATSFLAIPGDCVQP